jgi:hypothetical protein
MESIINTIFSLRVWDDLSYGLKKVTRKICYALRIVVFFMVALVAVVIEMILPNESWLNIIPELIIFYCDIQMFYGAWMLFGLNKIFKRH